MHPDDDSQTTLSKWPFIVGDVLLVSAALAIAILSGWQLTNWQVGACVAAVALGAGLFVLPYIVEFKVRVREEQEDRAADIKILEKHVMAAEQSIDSLVSRIRTLEAATANRDAPDAALLEAIDTKLTAQESSIASKEALIQSLREDLEKVSQSIPAGFDPEVLQPIEANLKKLEERLALLEVAQEQAKADSVPAKPEQNAEVASTLVAADESAEDVVHLAPIKKVTPIERPQRATRERHGPEESRLLKRAITEKGDGTATAVTRIIESKKKDNATGEATEVIRDAGAESDSIRTLVADSEGSDATRVVEVRSPETKQDSHEAVEPEPKPDEAKPAGDEVKPSANDSAAEVEKEDSVEAEALEAKQPEPEKEVAAQDDEAAKPDAIFDGSDSEPAVKPAADPVSTQVGRPEVSEPDRVESAQPVEPEKKTSEPAAKAPAADEPDMLFDPAKITSPVARTKAKKNDAVLTASVFIGIGNKPYLRGSGAGLNWEKGVAMEFQEIGKWRWVAPVNLDSTIELQIYRNDEDPDQSGKMTLEPGQKLEARPVFD